MKKTLRNLIIAVTLLFAFTVFAQEHEAAKPQEPAQGEHATNPDQKPEGEVSKAAESSAVAQVQKSAVQCHTP